LLPVPPSCSARSTSAPWCHGTSRCSSEQERDKVNSRPPAKSRARWPWRAGGLNFACLTLLCGVVALAAVRLFSGITEVGMDGVDTFEYWKYANEILHGKTDFIYDRLAFYAINVAALKILGANDYAIRAFVAGFTLLNIALVYSLAWLV